MSYTIGCHHINMFPRWRHQMETFSALLAFVGESTGHRWIPLTKASDAELRCFLWSTPEQTVEQTTETPVIWDAIAVIITSLQSERHGFACITARTKVNHISDFEPATNTPIPRSHGQAKYCDYWRSYEGTTSSGLVSSDEIIMALHECHGASYSTVYSTRYSG